MQRPSALLDLPDDCLMAILTAFPGPPSAQAHALASVGLSCAKLHSATLAASRVLVASHMERVREEAAYLCSEYTEWRQRLADAPRDLPTTLCIDVDGPVAAAASPLEALAHTIPVLPLQFSILSNSLTNLPCRAPTAPELWDSEALSGTGCIRRVGLDAWTLRGGCLGIVWETTTTEPPADGAEARRRAACMPTARRRHRSDRKACARRPPVVRRRRWRR